MKISLVAITALLAMALLSLANATPAGVNTFLCCRKHPTMRLRKNNVKEYYRTSSSCNLPSIVFTTTNGNRRCADPNAWWVKDLMEYLDKKNKSTS